MINLKIGGALLLGGTAFFVLSETLLGNSEAAAHSMFLGLVMFLVGLILTLFGLIQVLIARLKHKSK